mgnify:CR=1 FL=1
MKIVTFGLGRIGLPIALICADSGFDVVGVDINHKLVKLLNDGKAPFHEKRMDELLSMHINKNFFPKTQDQDIIADIKESDYIMIAVGTGFAKYPHAPKFSTLYSIIGQLIAAGIKDKTIILRVTLPIGTSKEIINLLNKKTGLVEGRDFWFAFVPERIMEGKAIFEERNLPKIIGCYSDESFNKVSNLFEKIGGHLLRVKNPCTAEFVKLIDNSWRNTRFAYANEISFLAENKDIDISEAIKCANYGYERNQIPQPGPVSGYCLGKDPYIMELAFDEIAKKRGFNSLWYYGRLANDWHIEKIISEIKGKNVLVAGLSFKANIDDYRYSHGVKIVKKLLKTGYNVSVCDPFLENNYYTTLEDEIKLKVESYRDIKKAIEENKNIKTLIITIPHDSFKDITTEYIKTTSIIKIIDPWNIL